MNNFISENIAFLIKKHDLSIDDFGLLFDLSRGVTGQYIRKSSLPKIITLQKICTYYKISIDDFINTDLSQAKNYNQGSKAEAVNEPAEGYGYVSLKYMALLEKSIEDKDKIIKALESKMDPDKSKTA